MVTTEFKTAVSTIRIHDEYCESMTDGCISRLSRIVSESYKRRQMQDHSDGAAAVSYRPTNMGNI